MRITLVLALALGLCSCSYKRIGSLTSISTRNVETTKPYVLKLRGVEAKAKSRHADPLQEAIDAAVKQHPQGEYLMNAVIYVKANGRKVKVTGDVYGLQ